MPANGRRGRPQGKCHRKQTARTRFRATGKMPAGKGETVRQERTALPATAAAGQTPPGARPNRGGRPDPSARADGSARGSSPRRPGWSREARSDACPRGMIVPCRPGSPGRHGQNPAYRPSGSSAIRDVRHGGPPAHDAAVMSMAADARHATRDSAQPRSRADRNYSHTRTKQELTFQKCLYLRRLLKLMNALRKLAAKPRQFRSSAGRIMLSRLTAHVCP